VIDRGRTRARELFLFVTALWCGALLFFAAAGARIVLNTAGSRHVGGLVNRALLDALDLASFGAIAFLALLLWLARGGEGPVPTGWAVRLLVIGAAGAFASLLVITPEMVALRDRMPVAIDLLEKSHPLRQAWGRLHGMSTLALLLRILASAGLFFLAVPRPRPRWAAARPDEERG